MKTWEQYLTEMSHKEIEKKEEETGKDLDHDGEKGESKEHKEKIKDFWKKKKK